MKIKFNKPGLCDDMRKFRYPAKNQCFYVLEILALGRKGKLLINSQSGDFKSLTTISKLEKTTLVKKIDEKKNP